MKSFLVRHPYVSAFIALAVAMQVILFFATREVALAAGQYAFIAAATVLLAGLCMWIITWER